MRALLAAGVDRLGGPARARVIVVLAAVLSVDSADKGAIGALAPQLESSFHIGNFDIGLLVAVSSLVGAAATLPLGVLADRVTRTRLLIVAIVIWAAAEAVSAFSGSYLMLLLTRVALGAVTAAAGPAVGSLTGDFFPGGERARIYGYILTGELLGSGAGLLVAGDIGAAMSWRAGFLVLSIPTLALAWVIHRYLPEPARGGMSRIPSGAEGVPSTGEPDAPEPDPGQSGSGDTATDGNPLVVRQVQERGVEAEEDIVIRRDPAGLGLWEAVKWVVRVRTNVLLIVSSCLGYFFFAGLKTFAVLFARGRFGVGQSVATLLAVVVGAAAIVGIVAAGYVADRRLARGRLCARLTVAATGYIVAAVVLVPAFLTTSLAIAIPLMMVGAAFVAAPNSPGDAARLDVVPAAMWGRTEAIRTFVRTVLEASAPLLFGFVSQVLGGGASAGLGAGVDKKTAHVSAAAAAGLAHTFLIMLLPLAAAGLLLLRARRTYPTDVASAAESDRSQAKEPADREAAAAPTPG